ncbi:MAG: hypothetical protein ACJLS3_10370 [Erythrobacter sp.]
MEQLPILRRQAKPQDLPALFTRAFERELERITMAQFLEPARVRHRHLTKHYARYFTLLAEQPHLLYGSKRANSSSWIWASAPLETMKQMPISS